MHYFYSGSVSFSPLTLVHLQLICVENIQWMIPRWIFATWKRMVSKILKNLLILPPSAMGKWLEIQFHVDANSFPIAFLFVPIRSYTSVEVKFLHLHFNWGGNWMLSWEEKNVNLGWFGDGKPLLSTIKQYLPSPWSGESVLSHTPNGDGIN